MFITWCARIANSRIEMFCTRVIISLNSIRTVAVHTYFIYYSIVIFNGSLFFSFFPLFFYDRSAQGRRRPRNPATIGCSVFICFHPPRPLNGSPARRRCAVRVKYRFVGTPIVYNKNRRSNQIVVCRRLFCRVVVVFSPAGTDAHSPRHELYTVLL